MNRSFIASSLASLSFLLLAPTAHAQEGTPFYDPPAPGTPVPPSAAPAPIPASTAPLPSAAPVPGGAPPASPPPDAPVEPFTRLGAQGEVVFSGASVIGASSTSYSGSQASAWNVTVSPGFDWFFAKNVSLGLNVNLVFQSSTDYSTANGALIDHPYTDIAIGPRVGVLFPLSREWSVWPRASALYELAQNSTQAEDGSLPTGRVGAHGFRFDGYVPLVYQPVSGFFFGFGPSISVPVQSQDYAARQSVPLDYGASFIVGGFVGGEPSAPEAPTMAPSTPAAHAQTFGDAGEWVFTGNFAVSGSHSSDNALAESSTSIAIEPSVDYFSSDNVSIGLEAGFSSGSSNGTNQSAAGAPLTYSDSTTAFFAGGRVGYNVRLGKSASLWLRATLGASVVSNNDTFSYAAPIGTGATLSWTDTVIYTSLAAPVLFHVSPHAFIGAGPTLYTELSRSESGPGLSGPNVTTVGGSLIVGGWL